MHTSRLSFAAVSLLVACTGEHEARDVAPYRLGQALVIGEHKGGTLTTVEPECESSACSAVLERCGDEAFADVVLDERGEVLDVVCYGRNVHVVELGADAVANASAGNDTVLVLDDADDGLDVVGDVTLSGNNAVVYGAGADVSLIGGTLAIAKNNAVVRGVRIRGDVTIAKNNAKLLFTTIEGTLTISGNNTTLAESRVLGEVVVLGNNTVLVQNELATPGPIEGKNLRCNGNVRIDAAHLDESQDAGAASPDAGAPSEPVLCAGAKKPSQADD
jgi:hypothetical protein